MDDTMKRCIDNCFECYRICRETIAYSVQKGGEYADGEHLRTLLDCAQICQVSAEFMVRGSAAHNKVCEICAEVCLRCAESCSKFNDEQLTRCAEACRECVQSCKIMAEA